MTSGGIAFPGSRKGKHAFDREFALESVSFNNRLLLRTSPRSIFRMVITLLAPLGSCLTLRVLRCAGQSGISAKAPSRQ